MDRVEYLGHFISNDMVSTDPSKIEAVKNWPIPTIVKRFRGFLGLTRYYRRFIKNYSQIAWPLIDFPKKEGFVWTNASAPTFDALKKALIIVPVLAMPDFSVTFVVETNAPNYGMGLVLMQNNHPITYISKGSASSTRHFQFMRGSYWPLYLL